MKLTAVFLTGLILPVAVMTPVIGGARAEGFVDLRLGGSFTEDTDLEVTTGPVGSVPANTLSDTTGFEYGVSLGIGGGYWFESLPWLGVALTFSYFRANEAAGDPLQLRVYPISGLLMLRAPLYKSDAYPHGRLQPYLGIGPAGFVTQAELDSLTVDMEASDTVTDVGLHAQLGVKLLFEIPDLPEKYWGVFMEASYTRYDPSRLEDSVDLTPVEIELDVLNTWHGSFGFSFHF